MLSPERAAQIVRRLEALPPVPWEVRTSETWWISRAGTEITVVDSVGYENEPHTEAVTDFIVHAPGDMRQLLAEIQRLRGLLGMDVIKAWEKVVGENGRMKEFISRITGIVEDMTERGGADDSSG